MAQYNSSDVAENKSQFVQIDSKATGNAESHASALFEWSQHREGHSARLAVKEGELEAETVDSSGNPYWKQHGWKMGVPGDQFSLQEMAQVSAASFTLR